MGFGYLFIGYLITFVLYLTVNALVPMMGGLALLVGFGTMMLGLWELTRYHKSFVYAKWTCVPLMAIALYRLVDDVGGLLFPDSSLLNDTALIVVTWIQFCLVIFFHVALLYAIRAISREVGLGSMEAKAIRNAVFVGLYAVVYLCTNLIFLEKPEIRGYFLFSQLLTELVYIVLNLLLLLSCTKNICAEGEEDVPAKPHRWAFLNKLDEVYDRTRQKRADQAREEGEAFAERRRRKKEQKKRKKH